ncbi:BatD family protein [Kaistella anthropi]|nr:BatD family protein [Kaistella anthropi]
MAISEVKDAKVNQRFNLTVLLEIAGENMQQETPLRMPDLSKFEILGSASEQNTVVLDAKKGDIINQMVYQLSLSPKQIGKLKFGSVLVTVNGKIYKTEPFEINVRDNEKNLRSLVIRQQMMSISPLISRIKRFIKMNLR